MPTNARSTSAEPTDWSVRVMDTARPASKEG
jgi:hypothetical protein